MGAMGAREGDSPTPATKASSRQHMVIDNQYASRSCCPVLRCVRFRSFTLGTAARLACEADSVALALVAYAVGRLNVVGVKLRTAKRNWNDLVQLIAPWVERR